MLLLPVAASASVAGNFRYAIDSNPLFPSNTLATRNSYIVLQAWETERAAALKAANPKLQVLVYQNLGAMTYGTGPHGLSSSGVNYAEATTGHPEWFLTEANGTRIPEDGYSYLWMADIGIPTYQEQWTANVIHLLQSGPWDGVLMDDTNLTPRFHVHPQSRIAKYPNDATYQAAVRSMIAYAGPAIQAAGKLAMPNIGSWTEYPGVAAEWLQFVSGGMDEMFAKWSDVPGEGYRSGADWKTQLEEIQTTERMGKRFLAITQTAASDTRAIRYGWASALLAASGNTAFMAASNYYEELWSNEYEVAIGEPTSSAVPIAGGAWKRTFANGLVVVNPTTVNVAVSFGGSYSGSGLTNATGATLGPNSAVILSAGATKSGSEPSGGTGPNQSGGAGSQGSPGPTPGAPGTGTTGASTAGGAKGTSHPVAVKCRRVVARAKHRGSSASRRRRRCARSSHRADQAQVKKHKKHHRPG
jgi:hypothetical protein